MPHRILRWSSRRIGYRGTAAFILGLIWVLIGISRLLTPDPTKLPDEILPYWVRGALWLVSGAFAMGWQLVKPNRSRNDHNVWALLILPPAWRFFVIVAAGILDVLRDGIWKLFGVHLADYDGTWIGGLIWLSVVALIATCASGLDRLPPTTKEDG